MKNLILVGDQREHLNEVIGALKSWPENGVPPGGCVAFFVPEGDHFKIQIISNMKANQAFSYVRGWAKLLTDEVEESLPTVQV